MSLEYSVVKIVVPAIGEKVPTHAAGLSLMGVAVPNRAHQGDSTYLLKESIGGGEASVVFFNEGSGRWDFVSTVPNDGEYILENWEKNRVQNDKHMVSPRHTFVKRTNQKNYQYLGKYIIKSLIPSKDFGQITLWQRA